MQMHSASPLCDEGIRQHEVMARGLAGCGGNCGWEGRLRGPLLMLSLGGMRPPISRHVLAARANFRTPHAGESPARDEMRGHGRSIAADVYTPRAE